MAADSPLTRRHGKNHRLLPRGNVRQVMAVVQWRVARPPGIRGALRIALWGIAVLGTGVAVALPDDAAMAALGVMAAASGVLAFIQPVVAILVLLVAIPFGSRASTTDTTTDPSIGAAELL